MPAVVRGGSRAKAKPPAKAPPGKRPATAARAPMSAKGGPRQHSGLSVKWTLIGAGAVLALAMVVTLSLGNRGQMLADAIVRGIDGQFGRAGFRLATIHVEGASPMATADIVKVAGLYKDQPLLGLDLEAMRQKIQTVGWVKEARVVRLLPDTLVVAVSERRQMAVWQHNGRSAVIDDHGKVIAEADPARFTALPLVVGEGGAENAPKILPILAQRPDLIGHMDALVRVDDRRWDLRMKDGSLIQLPAQGEEQALMLLEQLNERSRILTLGFERIDLRNPDAMTVRPRANAPVAQALAAGV
jgi:cell division protein FtsQ